MTGASTEGPEVDVQSRVLQILAALEEARKIKDTGAVQREMDKIQTILAQQEAADKAVTDVKTVLDDGKADEAAKLANEALGQYGGAEDRTKVLEVLLRHADASKGTVYVAMQALAAIDALGAKADPIREQVKALPKSDPRAPERVRTEYLSRLGASIQGK